MIKQSVIIFGMCVGLIFLSFNPVQAEHYDDVIEQHGQCLDDCEETRERDLERLGCDYYGTQSAYQSCERTASSARSSCNGRCNATEDQTISNCKESYRAEKKECRVDKREDKQECREAKRAEKEICKQNKIDEKVACRDLSGNAKRECKRQARQNKKDCKQQARQTKRACKSDARDNKTECKDSAWERRDLCISTAEEVARECRTECTNTYNAACVEEHQAYEACSTEANPIFLAEDTCNELCDEVREEDLEGYNPSCHQGGHSGDQGATITFHNLSGAVRHYYRPEPFPETPPAGPLTLNEEFVTSLNPGDTYVQEVACGMQLRVRFKDQRTDTSDFVGHEFILSFPCCEVPEEDTYEVLY